MPAARVREQTVNFVLLGAESVEPPQLGGDFSQTWRRLVCEQAKATLAAIDLCLECAPPAVGLTRQPSQLALGRRRALNDRAQLTNQRGVQRRTERSQISRPASLPNTTPRFHYPTRTLLRSNGILHSWNAVPRWREVADRSRPLARPCKSCVAG